MAQHILITGSTGNVGREVVRALTRTERVTRAACRNPERASLPEEFYRDGHSENGVCALDFEDPKTWDEALEGCSSVVLLRPPAISKVEHTLNAFCTRACELGVTHIIFISVMGADNMPFIPHARIEAHLKTLPCQSTMLRPGFFAQNFQDAYREELRSDRRVSLPAASARVAFLDVQDMGEVCAKILVDPGPHQGKAYTLTGPESVTFQEAVQMLSEVIQEDVSYRPINPVSYLLRLQRQGMSLAQAMVQTVLHTDLRRGSAATVDPTLERLIGRKGTPLIDYFSRCRETWL